MSVGVALASSKGPAVTVAGPAVSQIPNYAPEWGLIPFSNSHMGVTIMGLQKALFMILKLSCHELVSIILKNESVKLRLSVQPEMSKD